jgi:hypothetical protein
MGLAALFSVAPSVAAMGSARGPVSFADGR